MDYPRFKDLLMRVIGSKQVYGRTVYVMCRELKPPPPAGKEYLEKYASIFEADIKERPHFFIEYFRGSIYFSEMRKLNLPLIDSLLTAEVPETIRFLQAFEMLLHHSGQHHFVHKVLSVKNALPPEAKSKLFYSILGLPIRNYMQAKTLLWLAKEVGPANTFLYKKLIDRLEGYPALHERFVVYAEQSIASIPEEERITKVVHLIIKMGFCSYTQRALELLFEKQKHCLLTHIKTQKLMSVFDIAKILLRYNILDQEGAKIFSEAIDITEANSPYKMLLMAKADPNTPPDLDTVTVNNAKIWLAYPLKTIG